MQNLLAIGIKLRGKNRTADINVSRNVGRCGAQYKKQKCATKTLRLKFSRVHPFAHNYGIRTLL